MAAIIPLACVAAAAAAALLCECLARSVLSPLFKIPAPHWSCHFAPFWLCTDNIFTFEDNPTHSARKRIISGTFPKSFILADPSGRASMKKVLYERLLPLIDQASKKGQAIEVLELMYSYSMDSFVTWQFGGALSSNLIEDEQERRLYLDGFFAAAPYTFWQYEFPLLNRLFKAIGIIPKKVDGGFHDMEQWNLEKCDKAQELIAQGEDKLTPENNPVVMGLALKAMSDPNGKPGQYPQRLEIASDMFAHNSAAHETSGNTLTYCLYELSQHPDVQAKLRRELLTLDPPLQYPPPNDGADWLLPSTKSVDNLPYWEAVILETLRLYPSVPGGQPRRVPKACSLGGYDNIPANTTVQCYAYSLHRTPDVFPEPDTWKPERWIEATPEHLSAMRRWFWAFGSGGRMCIGSNFAWFFVNTPMEDDTSSLTIFYNPSSIWDTNLDAPVVSQLQNILGLINLASTTALSNFVSTAILFQYMSYSIPMGLLLWRGRNAVQHGPFWTGRWGLLANIVTVAWTVFELVVYSSPYSVMVVGSE
ncbi:hypothetical protein S40288_08203 [Stachybotrys chartarum IBT 40288]|nr:hypothetical protein S40288_08203 [Stachybotrys chartarum IBT 40288]